MNPLDPVLERFTQEQVAKLAHMSRSAVGMAAIGKRSVPEDREPILARLDHRAALALASERSGGYISNIYDTYPEIDTHPAAMKEILMKELREADQALEAVVLSRMSPELANEKIEQVLMELEDVSEMIDGTKGVWSERYGIDLFQLQEKRRQMIKNGER